MCTINTLNGNHKLTKDEKSKLKKYKIGLRTLLDPKMSLKSKCKFLVQKGGFIVPLLTGVLSGVIGSLIIEKVVATYDSSFSSNAQHHHFKQSE